MVVKRQYKASLKGEYSTEYYINRLSTDVDIKTIIKEEGTYFRVQIIEPFIKVPDQKDIESGLMPRARMLKLDAPDIVDKTASDIRIAYEAEQKVKEGLLVVQISKCEQNATADITLTIMAEENSLTPDICDYYSYIQMLKLAKYFDMLLDEDVEIM